jgi:hypothetical protein
MKLHLKSPTRLHGKAINYAKGEFYLSFHFWEKNGRKSFLNTFLNELLLVTEMKEKADTKRTKYKIKPDVHIRTYSFLHQAIWRSLAFGSYWFKISLL